MPINKWVIHTATGEFTFGGFYDPTAPDAEYSIVTLPSETMPNPRTQKWNGSAAVAKTAEEISIYDKLIEVQKAKSEFKSNPHLDKRLSTVETWRGIFTDSDPDGNADCLWLRYSTGFKPTVQLRARRNKRTLVLLSQNL